MIGASAGRPDRAKIGDFDFQAFDLKPERRAAKK
jgi:hypothetical protein